MINKNTVATVIGHNNACPIIACFRSDYNILTFICPKCKHQHYHGGGNKFGDGDGHRCAHCKEYRDTGYYIKEVKDWKQAGYLHKYDRNVRLKQRINKKKIIKEYKFDEFNLKYIPTLVMTANQKTYNVRWSHYPMLDDRLFDLCFNKIMFEKEKDSLWERYINSYTARTEMFNGGCSGFIQYVPKHVANRMYTIVKKYYTQALFRMKEIGYINDEEYRDFKSVCKMYDIATKMF